MKGKKKSIGEIESGMKHLRTKELAELVKIINDKCPELSKKVHEVVERADIIARDIADFKGKT